MQTLIPNEVKEILKILQEKNFEAYIVGGCVRDILLGIMPNDWDITTSAKPEQIKNIFTHTVDTGIKHGTVSVIINNKLFEITTYRIDGKYKDRRRPENICFTKNLREDLARRDFSINAIAYNKILIDPFGGVRDIKNKTIRCVGDAQERFREDALRILRALRFSVSLNFKIQAKTYSALKKNIALIKFISLERVRDELIKLFSSNKLDNIYFLIHSRVLKFINLEFENYLYKNISQVKINLERCDNKNLDILFAILFFKLSAQKSCDILRFLKLDNKTCKQIKILLEHIKINLKPDNYFIKKLIFKLGWDNFYKLLYIKQVINPENNLKQIYKLAKNLSSQPIFLKDLNINGNDIKNLGFKNKNIGVILNYLLDIIHKQPEKNFYDMLIKLAQEKN